VADVSITPSGAGLSATGYTGWGVGTFSVGSWSIGPGPTVVLGSIITPSVYNVGIVGYAPPAVYESILVPTGGTVLTGSDPTVVVGGKVITTVTGSISTAGYAPSTQFGLLGGWGFGPWGAGQWGTNDQYVYLATGSVSITGYAGTTVRSNLFQSNPAVLTITGNAPEVSKSVAPDSGTITATGYAPSSVYGNIVTATGGIGVIGSDPTVIVAGRVIVTGQGSITATGYAPTTQFGLLGGWGFGPWGYGAWGTDDTYINLTTGTLNLVGYAPTRVYSGVVVPTGSEVISSSAPSIVVGSKVITPDTGAVTATGQTPFLDKGIVTVTGSAVFTGNVVEIVRTSISVPNTGTATITGVASQVVLGEFRVPNTGTAQIIGIAPFLGTGIVTVTGTVNITGQVSDVVSGTIKVPTGAAVVTGSSPSVVVSGKVIVLPTGAANITGYAPSTYRSTVITPDNGTLRLVGGTATLSNPDWIVIDTTQTPSWVQIAA